MKQIQKNFFFFFKKKNKLYGFRPAFAVLGSVLLILSQSAFGQEPGDWQILPPGEDVKPGVAYGFQNTTLGHQIAYGNRSYGIRLVWKSAKEGIRNIVFESPDRADKIYLDQPIAIRVMDGSYLCYQKRDYGINLGWCDNPSYEWKLIKPKTSGPSVRPVKTAEWLALYNLKLRQYVIYGPRSFGINLVWTSDPTKRYVPRQKSGAIPTQFFQKGPAYGGGMYYDGQVGPGIITKITNPKINALGKAWTVAFVKPGRTSEECGNPNAVIPLAPGKSTQLYSGIPLSYLGFCLTSTDPWTLAAGWPPWWSLEITYSK